MIYYFNQSAVSVRCYNLFYNLVDERFDINFGSRSFCCAHFQNLSLSVYPCQDLMIYTILILIKPFSAPHAM